MRSGQSILLIACYELGHQPLSLAWPLAVLQEAGYAASALDLSVDAFSDEAAARARFVAISVPMHTALRLGVQAARRVRALNPEAHLCFFGLYAWMNASFLLEHLADTVIAGEFEQALLHLVQALERGDDPATVPGVSTRKSRSQPLLSRLQLPVPQRSALPPLERYARYLAGGQTPVPAGYAEASRGCLHTCRHCPVVPVYNGRFFVVPVAQVIADIRQQVRSGARHITFGDPDFLNGPRHALNVARALHAEFSDLTFDITTKVEHILKHRALFPELRALGCTFVVSAIESLSDLVLERLQKGHTAADVEVALGELDAAGIALHPTLVAFTPWTTLLDYVALVDFVYRRGLENYVPPIQLAIRLLIPPGSRLLELPDSGEWLGEPSPEGLGYCWRHPDPRMDRLYELVAARVEAAEQRGESAQQAHAAIRRLAHAMAGLEMAPRHVPQRPPPPRLTEHWFC